MGSTRGIKPTGASNGTNIMVINRDRLTSMYDHRNVIHIFGFCMERIINSDTVPQISIKMGIETS